jgi:hypothetical protein
MKRLRLGKYRDCILRDEEGVSDDCFMMCFYAGLSEVLYE